MKRVLMIDDDLPILEATIELLREEGLDAYGESVPERAIARARALGPHVVFVDLMMPGMDGVELARKLRADPGLRHVPIVLMTAHPDAPFFAHAAGATRFLRKPFSAGALIEAAREAAVPAPEADAHA